MEGAIKKERVFYLGDLFHHSDIVLFGITNIYDKRSNIQVCQHHRYLGALGSSLFSGFESNCDSR